MIPGSGFLGRERSKVPRGVIGRDRLDKLLTWNKEIISRILLLLVDFKNLLGSSFLARSGPWAAVCWSKPSWGQVRSSRWHGCWWWRGSFRWCWWSCVWQGPTGTTPGARSWGPSLGRGPRSPGRQGPRSCLWRPGWPIWSALLSPADTPPQCFGVLVAVSIQKERCQPASGEPKTSRIKSVLK